MKQAGKQESVITTKYSNMDDIIEIISTVSEPVVETLQDWGEECVDYVKGHAPLYLRYAVYALKGLHL